MRMIELSDVGFVIGWVTSVVGSGLVGAWLQRRHELQLKDKDHDLATTLHDAKVRAELEVERLRAQLDRAGTTFARVHTMAAEREFECYGEIWRDLMDFLEEVDKNKRDLPELRDASLKFVRTFRNSRPFYAESVFGACVALHRQTSFLERTAEAQVDWDTGMRRLEAIRGIDGEVETIAAAIRTRLDDELSLGANHTQRTSR